MLNSRRYRVRLRLESLETRDLLAAVTAPGASPYWQSRFSELAALPKEDADVVLLGDSILDNLRSGTPAWTSHFSSLDVANYAIGMSTAANVRWQIESGLLDGLTPRVVVLLVGTNDLAFNAVSPEGVVAEIDVCLDAIHAKMPESQVLLVGLLPRGEIAADPFRLPIAHLNSSLAGLQAKSGVVFVDVGAGFLAADGQIPAKLMSDFVHPSAEGYEVLASALADHLRCVMSLPAPQIPDETIAPGPVAAADSEIPVFVSNASDSGPEAAVPDAVSLSASSRGGHTIGAWTAVDADPPIWSWLITAGEEWWEPITHGVSRKR